MATRWHYNGIPEFLFRQASRLGIDRHQADLARHNKEIHRLSTLVNQLCERYHRAYGIRRARDADDEPVFGEIELKQIKQTLGACERQLEQLHILAASADEMMEQVYGAFSIDAPARAFIIMAESDDARRGIILADAAHAATPAAHSNGAPVGAEAVADTP